MTLSQGDFAVSQVSLKVKTAPMSLPNDGIGPSSPDLTRLVV